MSSTEQLGYKPGQAGNLQCRQTLEASGEKNLGKDSAASRGRVKIF
jgi:hypothetical protein